MAKAKTIYICAQCGYETSKWLGKCPQCDSWNSFSEEVIAATNSKTPTSTRRSTASLKAVTINEIKHDDTKRLATGMQELDRVLGGGLVEGSAVLIGGDPGIGKSTLLLQICETLAQKGRVLYASGEESTAQIKMRAQRLGVQSDNLFLLCENDMDLIEEQARLIQPTVLVVDSVQTVYKSDISSSAGSVTQVREATATLTRYAKQTGAAVFIVGHVTKQGAIAGPRVLEHLVDTVLYFEGDRQDAFRILRTVKNRFGSTNEIGVFEMNDKGMQEVLNPSALFVDQREQNMSGCSVICTLEGTRPVLAEVQALCSYTSFGTPRRTSAGVDYNRMALLCAVLEKKAHLRLNDQDIYVNVVGGLRIDERCADLGILAAIASSLKNKSIQNHTVALGEVGLTGEVRAVSQIETRLRECEKQGYQTVVMSEKNAKACKKQFQINIIGVKTIQQALEVLLEA